MIGTSNFGNFSFEIMGKTWPMSYLHYSFNAMGMAEMANVSALRGSRDRPFSLPHGLKRRYEVRVEASNTISHEHGFLKPRPNPG